MNDKIKLCTVDDETHYFFKRAYILRRNVDSLKRHFFYMYMSCVVLFCGTMKLNKASFFTCVTLSLEC